MSSGKVEKLGEVGVVGAPCRNQWYSEVRVGEEWGKVANRGWILRRGDQVWVREVWRSGDGRDVEWECLGFVPEGWSSEG